MKQLPLSLDRYPRVAGWKSTDTSRAAAADIEDDAATIRGKVVVVLRRGPLTADETAARLGMGLLSVRPRLSELRRMGRIDDTGFRRPNASGKQAIVWRLV